MSEIPPGWRLDPRTRVLRFVGDEKDLFDPGSVKAARELNDRFETEGWDAVYGDAHE